MQAIADFSFLGTDQLADNDEKERENAYRWEREVLCKPQSLQLAWCAADGCIRRSAEAPLGGGGITPSLVFVSSVLQLHVHGGVAWARAPLEASAPSFLSIDSTQGFSFLY